MSSSNTAASAASIADKYFVRNALWDWHDAGRIDLVDETGGVLKTLDEWQTLIFHSSDADRRVGEFIAWLATQYRNPAERPPDLAQTIETTLRQLVDDGVVALVDRSRDLPYHFELPRKEQDPALAQESMDEERTPSG